ncbi:hypothetical protein CEXT_731931 [Caerostris extrusa]|uniref:Uncharacterized protein n=1 Tax=Caerostris extrusa TaxID=172846 RepID=A0AAV4QAH1_CAEEX|nr:hypothetical protein CEXT_731931 [Caerostris extrusa]
MHANRSLLPSNSTSSLESEKDIIYANKCRFPLTIESACGTTSPSRRIKNVSSKWRSNKKVSSGTTSPSQCCSNQKVSSGTTSHSQWCSNQKALVSPQYLECSNPPSLCSQTHGRIFLQFQCTNTSGNS